MQHSNHRTAALIASKPARIITSAALAVALTATPMLSPVAAYAASQATQDQLSAAQKKIEDATSAYNDARTKLEDLQKQIDSNEANIDKIEAELPEQQAKASSAMRDLYKYQKGTSPIVSFLVNTQSLGDFITTCKYTNQITSSSVDEIEELNKMQTELEQNKTELDQAKSQLEGEQKNAEDALAQWKAGEATEDSFAALANELSTDDGSNTNGGLYTKIYKNQMVTEFNDWCFDASRQSGDTGIVYGESSNYKGYHVIYFVGDDVPYWQVQAENALRNTDTEAWLDGLLDSAEVVQENGMKYVG